MKYGDIYIMVAVILIGVLTLVFFSLAWVVVSISNGSNNKSVAIDSKEKKKSNKLFNEEDVLLDPAYRGVSINNVFNDE